jgi:AhpD family alkylhydroperoxidase
MTINESMSVEGPFLTPIENPDDPVIKQVFAMYQTMLGRVITPLKVHSARLPSGFLQFYGKISELDKELELSPETAMLIRERVARINICLFCIDANRAAAIHASMNKVKFYQLEYYSTSSLFTDAERAALDYVTELTKEKKVNPDTFAHMARYYSERAICEIVWLVASEHLYNMTNIGLNIHSDMLCEIGKK